MLAGVEVGFEFLVDFVNEVVDPRDRLELDASQNGTLQGLGECLLDFLGTSELGRRSA